MRSINIVLLVLALFASLALIVIFNPVTPFLVAAVVVLAFGVVLAFLGKDLANSILYFLSLIASMVAAVYLGYSFSGNLGALAFLVIDIVLFIGATSWLQRNQVSVPPDRVLLMSRYQGLVEYSSTASAMPRLPFEEKLAVIPLYDLGTSVTADNVETVSMKKFKSITIRAGYRVRRNEDGTNEARKVFENVPRSDSLVAKIKAMFGKDEDSSPLNPIFWDRLLADQIQGKLRGMTSGQIYEKLYEPTEIDKEVEGENGEKVRQRKLIERAVREGLSKAVANWGLEVINVGIGGVELDPEHLKNKEKAEEQINKFTAARIERVGEAQGQAYGTMIGKFVAALRKNDVDMSEEMIRQIVRITLDEMGEQRRKDELQKLKEEMAKNGEHKPKPA